MKIFKYLFFLILIVIIGFVIYVATLNGSFQVEETQVIEAPVELLFDEVNDYKTREDWSPWIAENPNMIISYTQKTSGEEAGYSWKTDHSNGSISTVKVIPGKSIVQKMNFDTSYGKSTAEINWSFKETKKGTEITWSIKGERDFLSKAYQLTQDSTAAQLIRPRLKAGLKNLAEKVKKIMEKYEISVNGTTIHSGGFYMYMTTASRNTRIALSKKRDKIAPQVRLYMQQNNIAINGAPMMIFNNIDEQNGTVIISVAIPTSSKVITPQEVDILSGFLPSQKVVKTTLKGNYKHLPQAWSAAKKFIEENGYELNEDSSPFQVYVINAAESPNPAEWITEIYIPIK